jgi:hypothetical protein
MLQKSNNNWFMIEIILTSYRITTYCNDFNNVSSDMQNVLSYVRTEISICQHRNIG